MIRKLINDSTDADFWTANAANVDGSLTSESFGNEVGTFRDYHNRNGRLERLRTYRPSTERPFQHLQLAYDANGNLEQRDDFTQTYGSLDYKREVFEYDDLNRLLGVTIESKPKVF